MKKQTLVEFSVFTILVALCVVMRLMDHAANFAPVAAATLFAGFWFTRRGLALLFPFVAMGAGDALIGTYHPGIMAVVYAAMAFPLVWRTVLRRRLSAARVGWCALFGSVAFFLTTNLAVWVFSPLYERTTAGLADCYVAAIPFFRNTVAADLVFAGALFGTYVLAARLARGPGAVPTHSIA